MSLCNPATFRTSALALTIFLIMSQLPQSVFAAAPAGKFTTSHDAFTVPDATVKKSVTGVDFGKYEIVVDNSTISNSLLSDKGIINLNIEFASGSTKLTEIAEKQIEQIAIALKSVKLINERIMIVGHTDNIGSAKANQKLSEKRALQVKKSLISSGIAATRLESSGAGESKPITDNQTPAGRARNRRVTLLRIKQ